jgi:transposase
VAGGKKNARRRRAWLVFHDESGVSQRPAIRRTWAPRGQTPVLTHGFNWKRLSVASVLAFRWDGRRSRCYSDTRPGSYNTETLIPLVQHLKQRFRGHPVILLWDGLPAHKSAAMATHLAQQHRWLTVERLPGYAPELNPVEGLWSNLKGQELANLCPDDLGVLDAAVTTGLVRVRRHRDLPLAFLRHAGLFL